MESSVRRSAAVSARGPGETFACAPMVRWQATESSINERRRPICLMHEREAHGVAVATVAGYVFGVRLSPRIDREQTVDRTHFPHSWGDHEENDFAAATA